MSDINFNGSSEYDVTPYVYETKEAGGSGDDNIVFYELVELESGIFGINASYNDIRSQTIAHKAVFIVGTGISDSDFICYRVMNGYYDSDIGGYTIVTGGAYSDPQSDPNEPIRFNMSDSCLGDK